MKNVMLSCGHSAMGIHKNDHNHLGPDHPCCVICDCCQVVDAPDLTGRTARCSYYGKKVKEGMYNANACDICKAGEICHCERPSNISLWFFKHKPEERYDEFYCACQGAD